MMKIFNRDGNGAEEIINAVGIIGHDLSYDKWEPLLPFGIRDVRGIVGATPVQTLCEIYMEGEDHAYDSAIALLQQSVAFFTWLKIIPTLDAQHDSAGRSRRLGENEKGLTALEQFKDEENIRHLAYEAVDALIEELEAMSPDWWTQSDKCRMRASLLIRDKETFDEYYVIGSHRLYVTLLPMLREVQNGEIWPIVGDELLAKMLDGDAAMAMMADCARRALALLTMKKAVERLPVEVLPEGVVQVQQSQPIKQRLKAEKEARMAVASSLGADAKRALALLTDMVAALCDDGPDDLSVTGPIVHSKGMSF